MIVSNHMETAAKSLIDALKNEKKRLHMTNANVIHLNVVPQIAFNSTTSNYRTHRKPQGLWYGIETSWIEWCADNMPDKLSDFIYDIRINENLILKIRNKKEFDDFEKTYGIKIYDKKFYSNQQNYIDFHSVAEKYCGIEISPFLTDKEDSNWYCGWDCASGCIWDAKAIIAIKLYAQFDEETASYIRVD